MLITRSGPLGRVGQKKDARHKGSRGMQAASANYRQAGLGARPRMKEAEKSPQDQRACREPVFVWPLRAQAVRQAHAPPTKRLVLRKSTSSHSENTRNMVIDGDNLEALKLLVGEYEGRVKVAYIDPPYNTMKDRMYNDRNSHDKWMLIMYPRLILAREMLADDGTIFVSIGLDEVHRLRIMMDDIFGEQNMISEVVWHSKYTTANDKRFVSAQHEYVLIYAKNISSARFNLLPRTSGADRAYRNPDNDPRGPWKATPLHAKSGRRNASYTFTNVRRYDGKKIPPFKWSAPRGRYPRYSRETLRTLEKDNRITCGKDGAGVPNVKTFLCDVKQGMIPGSVWKYDAVGHTHEANEELSRIVGKGVFDNPKPTRLIKRILYLATSTHTNDIVLDFFAGSGTTAHSVMGLNHDDGGNRAFICIQDSAKIDRGGYGEIGEIARYRIRKVASGLSRRPTGSCPSTGFKNFVLK